MSSLPDPAASQAMGSTRATPSLFEPVSRALRPTRSIGPEGSLAAAADLLRNNGASVLPVVENGRYIGVITESSLLARLGENADPEDAVRTAMVQTQTIAPYEAAAVALRRLEEAGAGAVAVCVDDKGAVWGLVLPSDLFEKPPVRLRPARIGGLATPFGVHLTTGVINAGPPWWALMATGAMMMVTLTVSRAAAVLTGGRIEGLLTAVRISPGPAFGSIAEAVLTFTFFAILMHIQPLAGYHAAEHQVVHAIERREPLTVNVVSRMPRVHPRCGTNIAAAAFMITFLGMTDFGIPDLLQPFQLIFALLLTLFCWQTVGGYLQYWVTTAKPKPHQVEAGIRSGEELLRRFETSKVNQAGFLKSIINSGLLFVMAGAFATGATFAVLLDHFGLRGWIAL